MAGRAPARAQDRMPNARRQDSPRPAPSGRTALRDHTMAPVVYILTALTSLLCALMLWRAYRGSGVPLLFWSALCFLGFSVSNLLLIVDLVAVPQISLAAVRAGVSLLSVALLLYGLIFKTS